MDLSGFGRALAILLTGSALVPANLSAQTVNAPTREEIERGRPPLTETQHPSKLTVEGGIERAPCPLADPQYADLTVTLSGAEFDGLQGLSPDMLRPAWEAYAGREVPIATLCEIRDSAATILRNAGYLAAVQVPPQRIEKGGVVHFDVLLAKLVAIQVRGDAGRSERLVAAHLEAVKGLPLFNIHEAERHLLLARDLPGYDVRLTLRPANAGPGEVIGEVSVTRQKIQVDANIQNYGSHETGRFGGLVRVQVNDLTGLGDATTFSLFNTAEFSEQTVLQAGHSFFVGHDGLRLAGDVTYAWTKPDIGLDIKSETLIASMAASYPFIRRQSQNLLGSAGFDLVNQKVDFGPVTLSNDNLRILFARLDYDMIDGASLASTTGYNAAEPMWRLGGSLEVRQGVSILDASKPVTGLATDPTAFVLRGSLYGEYRPIPTLTFSLSPRFQYSSDALFSYEALSAGNYSVGRGYDPGTIIGDSGIGLQAEMRYGSIVPRKPGAIAIQPFIFVDSAWIWNEDVVYSGNDPQKLTSIGGGIRGAWGNHARFDIALAVPLERAGFQTKKGDARLLFSLTTKLVPWR
ncbi:MAG: ShlB/FhaC/HecB family hemolysin secretion/activation protein [Alphaproteobacteria bacterium]|nr:ShlB/FhaC/HecB family hemolysin secretion/activation protein [Alphaproteobacteria bacterium]